MDQAYISTTAWVTQDVQARRQRIAAETQRRQDLYGGFMDELALLYSHALNSNEMGYSNLVKVFALRGRIALMATPSVIDSADRAVKFVVDLYLGPKRTPQEVRAMMDNQSADMIGEFARLCREEFRGLGLA